MSDNTEGWQIDDEKARLTTRPLSSLLAQQRGDNVLQSSDNPIVNAIGTWINGCPLDFGTDMAAHSGLLVGLWIGMQLDDDDAELLFELLHGKGLAPDEAVQPLLDHTTTLGIAILDGRLPD